MDSPTSEDQGVAELTASASVTVATADDTCCSSKQKEKDEEPTPTTSVITKVQSVPTPTKGQQQQYIILFYKYHPLSNDESKMEIYRVSLKKLCTQLKLKGRILVGCSETEGINGTLAGDYWDVKSFTYALLGKEAATTTAAAANDDNKMGGEGIRMEALKEFWIESEAFFRLIDRPILQMRSPEDFKWSRCSAAATTTTSSSTDDNDEESIALFPDLNIKLVRELIGTGGVLSSISLEETSKGYLTPQQWHDELTKIKQEEEEEGNNNDTVLIDCRNTKECEIGHFSGAIDPQTTSFSQFPKWVDDHRPMLENKKILMYCTGGIRCEKASAYVRRQVPSAQNVMHLKGGIHKYLEEVEVGTTATATANSHWQGKNFVFHSHVETKLGDGGGVAKIKTNDEDSKLSSSRSTTAATKKTITAGATHQDHTIVVGRCCYCQNPYDHFDPRCVCTVCREPLLACSSCQGEIAEFHCKQHFHLRTCYFTDLTPFSARDLNQQLTEIETIMIKFAVGKRFKQKRKTLNKQIDKIRQRLVDLGGEDEEADNNGSTTLNTKNAKEILRLCRHCNDTNCSGKCWGFLGLKRKEVLEQKQHAKKAAKETIAGVPKASKGNGKDKKRSMKEMNRERVRKEFESLGLCKVASANRDPATGIRVPPPCSRVLQTKMKGKWKGVPVLRVVKEEFMELAKPGILERVLDGGLLQVNGIPVTNENAGVGLQTGDTISRIVHWHEPPVIVPKELSIQKIPLPEVVKDEFDIASDEEDPILYVCNKPSSVPVHPAGPYLSNTLTMMAEAQEKLPPQSLYPCHRTDRVTSGLTICCTNSKVATVVQRSMCEKQVQKLYIARVKGKFYEYSEELAAASMAINSELVKASFLDSSQCVRMDAPIETVDPANGVRKITQKGKPASSLFRLISYDSASDLSVLCCRPITGRSHQLRVHLQQLGHPIVGDTLYGGPRLPEGGANLMEGAAVEALLKSTTSNIQEELRGLNVSATDASAAKKACALCHPQTIEGEKATSAAINYYTSAQLLESGHAINLHASRYRIQVLPKKKKDDPMTEMVKAIASLDLKVGSPDWAGCCREESLAWLEENLTC